MAHQFFMKVCILARSRGLYSFARQHLLTHRLLNFPGPRWIVGYINEQVSWLVVTSQVAMYSSEIMRYWTLSSRRFLWQPSDLFQASNLWMSCKRSTICEQQLPFYLQNSFRTMVSVRSKSNALIVGDKYSHKIEVQQYKSTDIYMLVCLQAFAAAQCTQRHVYRPFCTVWSNLILILT